MAKDSVYCKGSMPGDLRVRVGGVGMGTCGCRQGILTGQLKASLSLDSALTGSKIMKPMAFLLSLVSPSNELWILKLHR